MMTTKSSRFRTVLGISPRALALAALVAILAAVFCSPPTAASAADEYDSLRAKWAGMLTGGTGYDPSDPAIAARISDITSTGSGYDATMVATPTTYLWPDLVNTGTSTAASGEITTAYNRIRAMALEYSTVGSTRYSDSTLLAHISTALDWMNAHKYNSGSTEFGNWFDWEIGTPLAVNDIFAMLYSQLSAAQITANMAAIAHFTASVTLTGANRVWQATIIAVRGIISKNSTVIATGRDGLSGVLPYVAGSDGFYVDGSFVQHTNFSYLGAYGAALLQNLSEMLYVLQGSSWSVTDPNLSNVYEWIDNAVEPLVYDGAVMDMSRGRNVSRWNETDHDDAAALIQSVMLLAFGAGTTDASAFNSMVKRWIETDTFESFYSGVPIFFIARGEQIVADAGIEVGAAPIANHQFAAGGEAVSLRSNYAFGLSMSSNRIANYESINGENLKGWFTGDGETFLYNSDSGQFEGDYQPTIDPYRRPGTTENTQAVRSSSSGAGYLGGSNWSGGTSLNGLYGVDGMDFAAWGNTLKAKKSWFTFDDEIVALGAGITSTDGQTIETTVENRQLDPAGDNAFTVDDTTEPTTLGWTATATGASWAELAGTTSGGDIGYYFPGGQTLQLSRVTHTGTWTALNSLVPDNSVKSADYLTMSINHGTSPSAASYAYALLPGKSASQMATYASQPGFSVLANTSTIQAVKDQALNVVGANFWADGTNSVQVNGANWITSDKKSSVLTQETTAGVNVSVSDPTQINTGSINIEINRPAFGVVSHDPRITVTQLTPTIKFTVKVDGTKGTPVEASFGTSSGDPIDTNLALGLTTASITSSSNYVSTAFEEARTTDGDTESLPLSIGWSSNNTLTANHSEYIQYDLGATKDVNEVDLFAAGKTGSASFPLDVLVSTSTDGTSWTNTVTQSAVPIPGPTGLRLSFATIGARYVRITGTSLRPNPNDGNRYRMQLAEVQIRDTDLALRAAVSASSTHVGSGWGVAQVVDGQRASTTASEGWSSESSLTVNHSESLTVDLGAVTAMSSVDLAPVTVNGGYGFPVDFTIETSTNGTSWTTVVTRTAFAVPLTTQRFDFTATAARYVRASGTSLRPNPTDSNLYRMQFAEFEVR